MKLTPLDIHHKEFRHSLRGYAEDEVDQFLDEVADEFERLFKENIDLSERLEAASAKVRDFELKESAVNNAIIAAQTAGEDMRRKAQAEADSVLRDAEIKAKEIIHNALAKKQQVASELVRIKKAEEEFRAKFTALLDEQQRAVNEVSLPEDVTVLLAETDEGVVGDVSVRAPQPAAAPEPVYAPQPPFGETQAMPSAELPTEPPAPGFVQAVTLGEVESPDIPAEVRFSEPSEFSLPGIDALGEREDDVDIEEID
jgi:cell division initiation protein